MLFFFFSIPVLLPLAYVIRFVMQPRHVFSPDALIIYHSGWISSLAVVQCRCIVGDTSRVRFSNEKKITALISKSVTGIFSILDNRSSCRQKKKTRKIIRVTAYEKGLSNIHALKTAEIAQAGEIFCKNDKIVKKWKKLKAVFFFDEVARLDFDSPIDKKTPSIVILPSMSSEGRQWSFQFALLFGVDKEWDAMYSYPYACVKVFMRIARESINACESLYTLSKKSPSRFAEDNCRWASSPCGLIGGIKMRDVGQMKSPFFFRMRWLSASFIRELANPKFGKRVKSEAVHIASRHIVSYSHSLRTVSIIIKNDIKEIRWGFELR